MRPRGCQPCGQTDRPRSDQVADDDQDGDGQERQARGKRRQPLLALQEQAEGEDQAEEDQVDQQPSAGGGAERAHAKQRQRKHRAFPGVLDRDERGPGRGREGVPRINQRQAAARRPKPSLDGGPGQGGERDDGGDLPGQVGTPTRGSRGGGRVPAGEPPPEGAQRQVDKEDRPPPHRGDQQPADQRPGGQGRRAARRPHADRAGPACCVGVGVVDQRQRGRPERRCGCGALHGAGRDQLADGGDQAAGRRGQGEQGEAGHQQANLVSGPVPQHPEQARSAPRTPACRRRHDPARAAHAAAERGPDRLYRDVYHADVQLDHPEAQGRGSKHHAAARRRAGPAPGATRSDRCVMFVPPKSGLRAVRCLVLVSW